MADEWWAHQKGLRQTLRTEVAVGRKAPDAQLDQWAITIRYEDENPDDEPDRQPSRRRIVHIASGPVQHRCLWTSRLPLQAELCGIEVLRYGR